MKPSRSPAFQARSCSLTRAVTSAVAAFRASRSRYHCQTRTPSKTAHAAANIRHDRRRYHTSAASVGFVVTPHLRVGGPPAGIVTFRPRVYPPAGRRYSTGGTRTPGERANMLQQALDWLSRNHEGIVRG